MKYQLICIWIIAVFVFSSANSFCATNVIQTGIASPQNKSEEGNIEKLRTRAIRNALDLAIIQVLGTDVTSEKGNSTHYHEEVIQKNDREENTSKLKNRYKSGIISRSEGHAKLVEIKKEWQDKGQYHVRALISVSSQSEAAATKTCGDFWIQAGRPEITLTVVKIINGESVSEPDSKMATFLRKTLSKNGINLTPAGEQPAQYLINVVQNLNVKDMMSVGTLTAHCLLSYKITESESEQSLQQDMLTNGPKAAFSLEQAQNDCFKEIAPDFSKKMVHALGTIMVDRIHNGREYQLVIAGVPPQYAVTVSDILNNLFRTTLAVPAVYANKIYKKTIKFTGNASDLALSIQDAFADEDWQVVTTGIRNGKIEMQWKTD